MKLKTWLATIAIACLLIPQYAGAATVLEETGFIFGLGGENYRFIADQSPSVYQVTLTDLNFPGPFDILAVAITTASDNIVELSVLTPDTQAVTTFDVDLGTTYFANVLGLTDPDFGVGLFGLEIKAVPIPPSLILLGSSILGLVLFRRRVR